MARKDSRVSCPVRTRRYAGRWRMRARWRGVVVGLVWLVPRAASADLTGSQGIRDHVALTVSRLDVTALDARDKDALLAHRVTLNLGLLVPCYGSYTLDTKVYGELRPSAILFDWVLGGAAPVGLAALALADDQLPSRTRAELAWTALALYATSRVGILIVGNLHISDYNAAMRLRLGLAPADSAARAWTIGVNGAW
jgi:hypothetical protein